MKKLLTISAIILALSMVLSGCNSGGEIESSPAPTSEVIVPTEPIVIDSLIVGQWVPVGVEDSNGYLQFTEDGNMVRFTLGDKGELNYEQQLYYLTSEKTFRMIRNDNTVSVEYEFEVVDEGKTLNIYNNPALRIPSKFQRID